jgi:uncharacterized repeat protein (TIGR03803 family)
VSSKPAAAHGAFNAGTVYSLTTLGDHSVLHSFVDSPDGYAPFSRLINVNGTLYGTTSGGGDYGCGTVFSINKKGREKIVHSFQGGTNDGCRPVAGLVDVGGNLFGTTSQGGDPNSAGTIFEITSAGAESVLYFFQGGSDGQDPEAGLIDVDGTLYGTTRSGGGKACDCGTVFALTP